MMRTGLALVWRLRHLSRAREVVIPLAPRLLSDDMIGLKQAAIVGLGVVALPGYVCRDEVRSGALRRVLPTWLAGDSNDHGPRSLQTGPAAIGPRLHRSFGG